MNEVDKAMLLAFMVDRNVGSVGMNAVIDAANRWRLPLSELITMDVWQAVQPLGEAHPDAVHALATLTPERVDMAVDTYERLRKRGIQLVARTEPKYPAGLRALGRSAPPLLFMRGDAALLQQPCVAIVGARQSSRTGLKYAKALAEAAARAGACVVSGNAAGADTAAHGGALEAGGKSAFVLPFGLNRLKWQGDFPRYARDGKAVFISAYAPDDVFTNENALERNGLICALSQLVCVIEPRRKGGSTSTARHALRMGIPTLVYGETSGVEPLVEAGASRLPSLQELDMAALDQAMVTGPPEAFFGQGRLFA